MSEQNQQLVSLDVDALRVERAACGHLRQRVAELSHEVAHYKALLEEVATSYSAMEEKLTQTKAELQALQFPEATEKIQKEKEGPPSGAGSDSPQPKSGSARPTTKKPQHSEAGIA